MRVLRGRASVLASVALTWQIVALMIVPTAACCQNGSRSASASQMANCPMHGAPADATCPMHMQSQADRDCHCPRLGCSNTDNGFLALFGPIGVLPNLIATPALHETGAAVIVTAPSNQSLAPVPVAPPPRA